LSKQRFSSRREDAFDCSDISGILNDKASSIWDNLVSALFRASILHYFEITSSQGPVCIPGFYSDTLSQALKLFLVICGSRQ